MSNAVIETNPERTRSIASSLSFVRYNAFSDMALPTNFATAFDLEALTTNYRMHKSMVLQSSSAQEPVQALCYVRFPKFDTVKSWNSSDSLHATVASCYDQIENQLLHLTEDKSLEKTVEEGAAKSALTVVDELKKHNLAPPELSWHGGDAVVMLWSLGDTTYAITVTDGELGYVVRRNRKAVKIVDSIALGAFRLSDLR